MATQFTDPQHPNASYVVNDDLSFMTDTQIANHMLTSGIICDEDVEYIKCHEYHHLIKLHTSVGRWIRNTYGLWYTKNPLTDVNIHEQHPDTISYRVLQMYHKLLHNKPADPNNPSLSDVSF